MRRSASAVLSTAVSITLLSGFWAAAPAQAATPGTAPVTATGTVTLDSTGIVESDGYVTLSGTYRCTAPASTPAAMSMVRLTSTVWGVGGVTSPVCDGADHAWVKRSWPDKEPHVTVGPIQGTATLEWWQTGVPGYIIKVSKLSVDQKIVDLKAPTG
ncbi:DUF6299 family protein [Kitasatospora sp. NPDC096147]|uniref:DUF6299 family protein n=1 Tax=Kitasatospora sp. NPDC096147 TaxID=3364093 RepID=UPI0038146F01